MREFSTPMMQQYAQIKKQHPDALLFFRLGDFYELFMDDAQVGAKVLGITLTQRPRGKDGHIPMAGVPFHSADTYIAKLTRAGYRVAICEQVSEPDNRTLVERSVVRIISPGTVLDEHYLESNAHNYVAVIVLSPIAVGLSLADISTGDIRVTHIRRDERVWQTVSDELWRWRPTECVIDEREKDISHIKNVLSSISNIQVTHFKQWSQYAKKSGLHLRQVFGASSLEKIKLHGPKIVVQSVEILLGFLEYSQQSPLTHLKEIEYYSTSEYLQLDQATIRNLELFETLRDHNRQGSVLASIDQTHTPMGGRLLRSWLRQPLQDIPAITARHDAVAWLYHNQVIATRIEQLLDTVADIERIVSQCATGLDNASRLVQLQHSLAKVAVVSEVMRTEDDLPGLFRSYQAMHTPEVSSISEYIARHISSEVTQRQETGIINDGVDVELDKLRTVHRHRTEWLEQFEQQQRQTTGIPSLKCRYNKVFGFYIEVSKSYVGLVPASFRRKQTLVNGERFTTPEFQEHEALVLEAEASIEVLEKKLYQGVLKQVLSHMQLLQSVAQELAELDCILSLATQARRYDYTCPTINTLGEIYIEAGRHPVVEQSLNDVPFVPNNTTLNKETHQLLMITGPNMAGKSVYMRQIAVITLLAHIGSFVPARVARIALTDRICIRSGASDGITAGVSTFMVEMVETAHILQQATGGSLVILDEIGRGTSTFDGISIAWAVASHLVTKPVHERPLVLFATHYHELQELATAHPQAVKNYSMKVAHQDGQPVFLHLVEAGPASHSYGIAVAQMAGVPASVIEHAQRILDTLEGEGMAGLLPMHTTTPTPHQVPIEASLPQASIMKELLSLNISSMTPLQSLQKLAEWQELLDNTN